MSDAGHGCRSSELDVDTDDLRSRFRNVREALPETAVAKPESERFHRHEAERDDPTPACTRTDSDDYHPVDVDEALLAGLEPCRACWRSVLEYLATEPDSPVAYRSPTATPEPSLPTTDEPFPPEDGTPERPQLSALTDEVMVGSRSKYHAPAGEETLCGRTGYRVVERSVVETHYDPCLNCFDEELAEE